MAQTGTTPIKTPETAYSVEDSVLDTQRSGLGFINYMLFPLIALAALAFAASELVR